MGMSLERSQLRFTPNIYAHNATNSENFTNIGGALSKITGLEPVVTRSSAIAEGPRDAS